MQNDNHIFLLFKSDLYGNAKSLIYRYIETKKAIFDNEFL